MKNSFLLLILCFSVFAKAQNPIVATSNGKIKGTTSMDKTVRVFKGIPFAAAPIGNLRWKAPQALQNWKGIKQCTRFSASPIQNKPVPFYCWSEEFIAQPEPIKEDCLYLNVWTSAKAKSKKQPVFVWIYGGGLNSGSANCAIYDGEEMAKKGVVFISINYRVGVFGFMAHPELSKESGHNTSGNYGFLDQMAALKWVQKNAAAFGGDPNNVTIAGQSAGAFSVTALIASPLAKGLFHKAIAQSGGLFSNMLIQNLEKAENQGVVFMKKTNTNSIAELRKIPAEALQLIGNNPEVGGFGTTLDGYVLPVNLLEHFKKGLHNQTPILTGWVTGDGNFLGDTNMSIADYKKEAQTKYGDKADAFLNIFPANTADEVKSVKQKLTLLGFAGLPAHLLASYNTKASYVYQFGHVAPDKPNTPNYGAFHTSEVPYVLHNLHTWNRPWQPLDTEIETIFSSYWVNFAKTGNPNGSNLPEWKMYDQESGAVMVLGDKIESKSGFFKKEFAFLEKN
ncbi:carboxylesterase/lipase family protein [Flavobacterium restrictum]|uniref:Carboxylic ester hydrolase n=1 Tax=Flavobacterium restrictum TaxID=2594428 RepID=A0A553EDI5_9FLAO|nr:carboxylesterase family protein [Flavobacterium restrictum]TRX43117.1 carboxylesterase family protein [Flavobacterium restrictum]